MNEITILIIFVLWYVGALIISENTSKNSKPGKELMFFIGMIFSPVIALILLLLFKKHLKTS